MRELFVYSVFVSILLFWGCNGGGRKSAVLKEPEGTIVLSRTFLPEKGEALPSIDNVEHKSIMHSDRELVAGANAFAYRLFASKVADCEKRNFILSPLSWDYAMAMIAAGASQDAREEIMKTMGWNSVDKSEVLEYHRRLARDLATTTSKQRIFLANALWINKGKENLPTRDYPSVLLEYFDAGMAVLDLSQISGIRYINDWIECKSYGKIKDLLAENIANPNLRFILTDVLYFNAPWRYPFDKGATREGIFTTADGKKQKVAMMRTRENLKLADLPEAQILRLPTEEHGFNLDIILPKNKNAELTADFLIKHDPIKIFADNVRYFAYVDVFLPKFKFTTSTLTLLDSEKPREAECLNLGKLVRQGALIGIMNDPDLIVGKILQKSMVGWDEEGLEAAAATGVAGVFTSMVRDPEIFKADHPFFFIISHESTGKLMFIGQVNRIE